MDRKDLISLMEAYEDVALDKEIDVEPEAEINLGDDDEFGGETDHEEVSHDDMVSNEEEKQKMVEAHLHTIRSHAHEIHTCIENGANIEPWMEEKIAVANDYIVHVANAIMYRK